MNCLRPTVLLFTALSVCSHGNAFPTRFAIGTSGSTCASAGHINGCCVSDHNEQAYCYVPEGKCYCDVACHKYRDCCSDISDIQCFDSRTCRSLGFSPGCCSFTSSSCYVPKGTCYCDPSCHSNGDCCTDVTITQCPTQIQRVSQRVDGHGTRAQRAKSMRARWWQSEVAGDAAMYRDAMANRVQNIRG